jgi:predicted O-methyltransferase YrrM
MRHDPSSEALILQKDYVSSLITHRPHQLAQVELALRAAGKWGVNVGDEEGALLALLIQIHSSQRVLEIGTQFGYSTTWMLSALSQNAKLYTLEKDFEHAAQARIFLASEITSGRVILLEGEANESLNSLTKQGVPAFDFIFIDADKSNYPHYLEWSVAHLPTTLYSGEG